MEPKATNNEEIEIDLRELFFVLLEHIRMIIASTILVALIALAYSKLLVTPMYASTSELYVQSPRATEPYKYTPLIYPFNLEFLS